MEMQQQANKKSVRSVAKRVPFQDWCGCENLFAITRRIIFVMCGTFIQ